MYDEEGRSDKVYDEEGRSDKVYDEEGRSHKVYDEEGRSHKVYDEEGRSDRVRQERGNKGYPNAVQSKNAAAKRCTVVHKAHYVILLDVVLINHFRVHNLQKSLDILLPCSKS